MIYFYSKSTPENGVLWAKCNDLESVNIMYQYLIDNINGLNDFYVSDGVHTFKFLKLAYKFGFKKRTFYERLKDIKTGDVKKPLF